jgi:hypothetical protein
MIVNRVTTPSINGIMPSLREPLVLEIQMKLTKLANQINDKYKLKISANTIWNSQANVNENRKAFGDTYGLVMGFVNTIINLLSKIGISVPAFPKRTNYENYEQFFQPISSIDKESYKLMGDEIVLMSGLLKSALFAYNIVIQNKSKIEPYTANNPITSNFNEFIVFFKSNYDNAAQALNDYVAYRNTLTSQIK